MNSNNKMSGWNSPDFISNTEKNHKVFFNKNINKFRELGDTPKKVNGKSLTDSEVVDFLMDTSRINLSVYRDLLTIIPSVTDDGLFDTLRKVNGLSVDSTSEDRSSERLVIISKIKNTMTESLRHFCNPKNVDDYRSTLTKIYSTITSIGDSLLSSHSPNDPENVSFYQKILTMMVQDGVISSSVWNLELYHPDKVMSFVHDYVMSKKEEPIITLYMVLSICSSNIYTLFHDVVSQYPPNNRDNNHFHQFCWDNIYKGIPNLDKRVFVHDWTNEGLDIVGKFQVKMDQLLRCDIKTLRQLEVIRYHDSTLKQDLNQWWSTFVDKNSQMSGDNLKNYGFSQN